MRLYQDIRVILQTSTRVPYDTEACPDFVMLPLYGSDTIELAKGPFIPNVGYNVSHNGAKRPGYFTLFGKRFTPILGHLTPNLEGLINRKVCYVEYAQAQMGDLILVQIVMTDNKENEILYCGERGRPLY